MDREERSVYRYLLERKLVCRGATCVAPGVFRGKSLIGEGFEVLSFELCCSSASSEKWVAEKAGFEIGELIWMDGLGLQSCVNDLLGLDNQITEAGMNNSNSFMRKRYINIINIMLQC